MTAIGFTFSANGIYVCVLSGTKNDPILIYKDKLSLPQNYSVQDLVEWFETELKLIIDREKPTVATYRLTISNITNNYVSKVFYGQAILNLLCAKGKIEIEHTSPISVNQKKFGLTKGDSLHDYIHALLKFPESPWDAKMKDNALMTLTLLK